VLRDKKEPNSSILLDSAGFRMELRILNFLGYMALEGE
jgi:hypothetical protein